MRRRETVMRQEIAVGVRGRGEAIRHGHAELPRGGDHLAERGVLAADLGDVVATELGEGNGVRRHAGTSC